MSGGALNAMLQEVCWHVHNGLTVVLVRCRNVVAAPGCGGGCSLLSYEECVHVQA